MQRKELSPGVSISNDRCLLLNDGAVMVISDLHLGYESALEEEGLHLPRINTNSIKESLHQAIHRYEPDTVVLLGDIKHDFRRPDYECRREILEILDLIAETSRPVMIRGNHDNYLQNIITGTDYEMLDHIDMAGFRLEHGHSDSGRRPVILGHEHPSLRIYDGIGAHIKLPCFLHAKEEGVIVIPSFSRFSGGNDIGSGDIGAFMSPALKTVQIRNVDVYAVSEIGLISLGNMENIQTFRF